MMRALTQRFHTLGVSKGGDFSLVRSYFIKNEFRIGIGRKIGKTKVEWVKNELTHATVQPLAGSTRECHAPRIFCSRGSSVRFGNSGSGGPQIVSSVRHVGTVSVKGCELGCVAGDVSRREVGAAFSQAAFDACPKVVGSHGPPVN